MMMIVVMVAELYSLGSVPTEIETRKDRPPGKEGDVLSTQLAPLEFGSRSDLCYD